MPYQYRCTTPERYLRYRQSWLSWSCITAWHVAHYYQAMSSPLSSDGAISPAEFSEAISDAASEAAHDASGCSYISGCCGLCRLQYMMLAVSVRIIFWFTYRRNSWNYKVKGNTMCLIFSDVRHAGYLAARSLLPRWCHLVTGKQNNRASVRRWWCR